MSPLTELRFILTLRRRFQTLVDAEGRNTTKVDVEGRYSSDGVLGF